MAMGPDQPVTMAMLVTSGPAHPITLPDLRIAPIAALMKKPRTDRSRLAPVPVEEITVLETGGSSSKGRMDGEQGGTTMPTTPRDQQHRDSSSSSRNRRVLPLLHRLLHPQDLDSQHLHLLPAPRHQHHRPHSRHHRALDLEHPSQAQHHLLVLQHSSLLLRLPLNPQRSPSPRSRSRRSPPQQLQQLLPQSQYPLQLKHLNLHQHQHRQPRPLHQQRQQPRHSSNRLVLPRKTPRDRWSSDRDSASRDRSPPKTFLSLRRSMSPIWLDFWEHAWVTLRTP